jgi:hypothetical protein
MIAHRADDERPEALSDQIDAQHEKGGADRAKL